MTKKLYAAPRLRSFGSVRDLTRSSVPGGRRRRRRRPETGWSPSGSHGYSGGIGWSPSGGS